MLTFHLHAQIIDRHAAPGSPEFLLAYQEAHASVRRPKIGTIMSLIVEFKGSAEFNSLAPSSIENYLRYLKMIEVEFGDMPLIALEDRRVRGEFKAWRDRYTNTPRTADYLWTTLARVLSFGKNRGIVSGNPCEGGGRPYKADRADKI